MELIKSYNEILKLSKYDCVDDFLIQIDEKNYLTEDLANLNDKEKELLANYNPEKEDEIKNKLKLENKKSNRNFISRLPKDCHITKEMIPKYCYYKPSYGKAGDAFVIDKTHPKVTKPWVTSCSVKYTTQEKFAFLLNKLRELGVVLDEINDN